MKHFPFYLFPGAFALGVIDFVSHERLISLDFQTGAIRAVTDGPRALINVVMTVLHASTMAKKCCLFHQKEFSIFAWHSGDLILITNGLLTIIPIRKITLDGRITLNKRTRPYTRQPLSRAVGQGQ